MKKLGHDTLFAIILLHNINIEERKKKERDRVGKRKAEEKKWIERGGEGKINQKETLTVVISLLKTVWRDLIVNNMVP